MVPSKTQVLVVGGGPAGSYCAGILAREGLDVVLLESATHPRYHIGESQIPSVRPHLRFFGLEEEVKNYGFIKKVGAASKFHHRKKEGYTDFLALSPDGFSWNVERADFDNLLFRHAAKLGAKTFEQIHVTDFEFAAGADAVPPLDPATSRPVAALYKHNTKKTDAVQNAEANQTNGASATGRIEFEWLVDTSGRAGLMSTKYLKNRNFRQKLKNLAAWAYWEPGGTYDKGGPRENSPWFEALIDGSGWAWYIPLRGKTSVGVVLHEETFKARRKQVGSLAEHYGAMLQLAPGALELLGNAKRLDDKVQQASDFSYDAGTYGGDHFRLAGDAGCFIDPLFSSGCHLALTGGLSAAASIMGSIKGEVDEKSAVAFHNGKIGIAYMRLLIVVLAAYKQILNQDVHVLSDINTDNFDRAFELIRPVIQGHSDVSQIYSSSGDKQTAPLDAAELQKTIEFVGEVFHGGEDYPLPLAPHDGSGGQGPQDRKPASNFQEAAVAVVDQFNESWNNLTGQVIDGYSIRAVQGELGISKVPQAPKA